MAEIICREIISGIVFERKLIELGVFEAENSPSAGRN